MAVITGMQDIFGQHPRLNGYTHLALCFSTENIPRETITTALEKACHQITTSLPWLSGKVINQNIGPENSGIFTVTDDFSSILRIQDRTDELPSYEELISTKGPSNALPISLLSNQTSLPDLCDMPTPVTTLTASWIKNGVVIDCAAHHNMLDISGMDQIFRLLSVALQGEGFSQAVIDVNTTDRLTLFPLLGPDEEGYDHSAFHGPSRLGLSMRPALDSMPATAYHYFRFSAEALSQLKKLATPTSESDILPSTDDALSAFIWKRLSTHRLHLTNHTTTQSIFRRALNCRAPLGVSPEYMGNLAIMANTTLPLTTLSTAPLPHIATTLRTSILQARNTHYLRSLATFIANEPDKTRINFSPGFNIETGIAASSWAGVGAYQLGFGVLGKPGLVRRPESKPAWGMVNFFPRNGGGDIDVLVCLRDEEVVALRGDVEWCAFAEYIG